jgi:peptidoglycan/LPS O-acetylase OafA/YrhL
MTATSAIRPHEVRRPDGSTTIAKRPFQTDIEGLRAIAVTAVVAFHATIPGLTGGFVGVDVFFVISGYLITGQLMRELLATGKVRLGTFYIRRAKRLLPAAAVVLIAIAIATALLDPLLGVYHTAQDLLAAALYTTNWHFISLGTDYLAQSTDNSPVLHFWSLAVEEQFYLIWPVLLIGTAFVARRLKRNPTRAFTLTIGLVSTASLIAAVMLTFSDPKLAYMATQARAWEFGIGALVAIGAQWLAVQGVNRVGNAMGIMLGWAGIAAVIYSIFAFDSLTPFPGYAALVPTLGTAAIICSGLVSGTSRGTIGSVLSLRPLRYIGRVSYSWYLWHWPVLVLVEAQVPGLSWQWRALLMVGALLLAIATLHLIEVPVARWRLVTKQTGPAFALGLLCMVTVTALVLGVGGAAVKAMGTAGAEISTTKISASALQNAFGTDTGAKAGAVVPDALHAGGDIPTPASCLLDHEVGAVLACKVGPVGGTSVVLFGDSHANQWLPALEKIATTRNWRISVFTKSGCPVANIILPKSDGSRLTDAECIRWRARSITEITTQVRPALIIVGSFDAYIPDSGQMLSSWNASLDKLRKAGAPIAYLRDTPAPTNDVPTCVSSALDNWSKCAFTPRNFGEPVIQQTLIGNEPDVKVIDMYKYFCTTSVCPAVKNGVLLYRDFSHISATAAKALTPQLDKAFVDAALIPQGRSAKP